MFHAHTCTHACCFAHSIESRLKHARFVISSSSSSAYSLALLASSYNTSRLGCITHTHIHTQRDSLHLVHFFHFHINFFVSHSSLSILVICIILCISFHTRHGTQKQTWKWKKLKKKNIVLINPTEQKQIPKRSSCALCVLARFDCRRFSSVLRVCKLQTRPSRQRENG